MATVFKRAADRRTKGSRWIVRWLDAESNKWRNKTGYTDKVASLELGKRLESRSARLAEGITDLVEEHRNRPITEHVEDFVAKVRAGNRNSRYLLQLENRILRVINGTKAERLCDLDAVRVTT